MEILGGVKMAYNLIKGMSRKSQQEKTVKADMFNDTQTQVQPTSPRVEISRVVENANARVFDGPSVNVEKINIGEIKDTTGMVSKRIEDVEDNTGISVLPFSITNVMQQVTELKRHKKICIDGQFYSSGTTRIVNKSLIEQIKNEAIVAITQATPFAKSLWTDRTLNGRTFRTLLLNNYEVRVLKDMFADFNARVVDGDNGDIILKIGDLND